MKNIMITEAFGHGIWGCLFAKTTGLQPVAISTKGTKEEFEAETQQIYNNLHFFIPEMKKAEWGERKEISADGWNFRQDLLDRKISAEMWREAAKHKLTPAASEIEGLPSFDDIPDDSVMVIMQKLKSDEACGATAQQQSLYPGFFNFIKGSRNVHVLGQHFHKVNDLEAVSALAKEFGLLVPGMIQHPEVFGIRGVQHKMYWNLYSKIKGCIGIAGTHTAYALACFPEIAQVILHNVGIEAWDVIAGAYQAEGYNIHSRSFDNNSNMQKLSAEVGQLYKQLF